jgi:hypothetical protein
MAQINNSLFFKDCFETNLLFTFRDDPKTNCSNVYPSQVLNLADQPFLNLK